MGTTELSSAARTERPAARIAARRLRPIWLTALLTAGLFGLFRAGMMAFNAGDLAGLGAREIARGLLIGARYDAAAVAYAVAPLAAALMLAPNRAFGRRWFNRLVSVYAAGVLTLALMVEIVGAAFFQHYGERLNWKALDYFSEYREIGTYIWRNYPVVWLLLLVFAFAGLVGRRLARILPKGPPPANGTGPRAIWAAGLLAVCAAAAWAGLAGNPLRAATFSDNKALCQLAMNNLFAISQAAGSVNDPAREPKQYSLPPAAEAMGLAAELLTQPSDLPLGAPDNPLWRRANPSGAVRDLNVVVIIMEGMAGGPVGALGNTTSYTPFFDSLCREGLFFDRMYAVGGRTNHGVVGVLCAYPDFGRGTVLKSPGAIGKFLTLPSVFADRGYDTMFIYGGDPNFDNMRQFLTAGGVQTVLGQADMGATPLVNEWGAFDEIALRRAHEAFLAEGDRRFFATVLTLSNHEPFDVPPGRCPMVADKDDPERARQLNAYRYADWALEEFFRMARSADYFEKTLFVLVSDHGRDLNRRRIMDCPGYRVPCVFYAPGVLSARRVGTVASQTDIAPTLLALLGQPYEHCWIGRDVLEVAPGDGMALIRDGDRLAMVRSDRTMVLLPSGEGRLFATEPTDMRRLEVAAGAERDRLAVMQRDMLSLHVAAWRLYADSAYRAPLAAGARRDAPLGASALDTPRAVR